MDIYIIYWNSEGKRVEVRYYETDFMGHTTVQDIQYFFNEKLESLSTSKLLQIGMDGPNVNSSFCDKLSDDRSKLTLPELLHTGSCGLNILHGSFKTAENATDWKLGKTLKVLFNFFSDSPSRRADYTELRGMPYATFRICKNNHQLPW